MLKPSLLSLSLTALVLSGCMGTADAIEVQQGRFTFHVSQDGATAVARNYHTGRLNFAQLQEDAQKAIETATGCSVRTLAKRGELNIFDATLNCAG